VDDYSGSVYHMLKFFKALCFTCGTDCGMKSFRRGGIAAHYRRTEFFNFFTYNAHNNAPAYAGALSLQMFFLQKYFHLGDVP